MTNGFSLPDFNYAHRGLWDEAAPENSPEAFRLAVQSGLGAECDVHVSRDGVPVVHHDANLKRMTGHDARIGELDLEDITALTLEGTTENVPTLAEILKIMGKLPLLVELKVDDDTNRNALSRAVMKTLAKHSGPVAVMSFDAEILSHFRDPTADYLIGLLTPPLHLKAEGAAEKVRETLKTLVADFLACHVIDSMDARAALEGTEVDLACWTVSLPEHLELARAAGAAPIFENLDPALVSASGND